MDGLVATAPGDLLVELVDASGSVVARATRCGSSRPARYRHYLGRPARPVGGDDRHQQRRGLFRLRPRSRLRRCLRASGQRLPDHRCASGQELNADHGALRRAGPLRGAAGLRVVGQHRARRRPQRLLSRGRADHPPLLARADRRRRRSQHRLRHRRRPVRGACRATPSGTPSASPIAAAATPIFGIAHDGRLRALGRGALGLGHVRVAAARRLRARPSRRRRRQLRRPQGAARRQLPGRRQVRRDRRAQLLPDAGTEPRERCSIACASGGITAPPAGRPGGW